MITTTLNKISALSPPKDEWEKLLKHLGKVVADDEPLRFSTIAESNGLSDAMWFLRSICPEYDKDVILFFADCAEAVLHIYEEQYPEDVRPRQAIEGARKFANGEIKATSLEALLEAAWEAAGDASGAATWAESGSASWDAVRCDVLEAQAKMLKERFS
jgi:hypothetical protein